MPHMAIPAGVRIVSAMRCSCPTRSPRTLPVSGCSSSDGSRPRSAASTRLSLDGQRRYRAPLPVPARAATPSMVRRWYPTSASSPRIASKIAFSSCSPRRRVPGRCGQDIAVDLRTTEPTARQAPVLEVKERLRNLLRQCIVPTIVDEFVPYHRPEQPMQIAVFGATGRTGRHIMRLLAEAGHGAQSLVRDPAAAQTFGDAVIVVRGDLRDSSAVTQTIDGSDAVISAFGQRSLGKDDLQEIFYRNLIAAMKQAGPPRLVALSAHGVGDSCASVPAVFRLIRSTMLKNVYDDKDRADALLIASGLDYTNVRPPRLTNVRPPRLTNGPAAGAVRTSADGRGLSKSISRADVAAFLVSQLDDRTWLRQSPVIGN